MDAGARAAALDRHAEDTSGCERCALSQGRSQVVYGSGDPHAALMIVGEAPGFHEDRLGRPFAGQAGELLEQLLEGIGIRPADVYCSTVLKCRPPGNRDPLPDEVAACEPHLFRQLELVRPAVVATLGNFATRLLSGRPLGITKVHGIPHPVTVADQALVLYPLYHPAAALYTPSMLRALEDDFRRIPSLLDGAGEAADMPAPAARPVAAAPRDAALTAAPAESRAPEPVQLGLF